VIEIAKKSSLKPTGIQTRDFHIKPSKLNHPAIAIFVVY